MPHVHIRAESRPDEARAPLTPADTARLIGAGMPVTVEPDPARVFPVEAYAAAGARPTPPGSWVDAARDDVVLGLKELPQHPRALRGTHLFFGHAFKGQPGAPDLLARFALGGGRLLDLESLVDDQGRRVAAFGYWAGYVGAALAVLHRRGQLPSPLTATTRSALDARLRRPPGAAAAADPVRALVVGARGRSGRGACDALAVAGVRATRWDVEETADLDRRALLAHDVLVNTVAVDAPAPPLLRSEDLDARRALRVVADVTCDVGSAMTLLPVSDRATTWDDPVRTLTGDLDVIAIDNLPSLLPAEASRSFSADLVPHLLTLGHGGPVWDRALRRFEHVLAAASDPTTRPAPDPTISGALR